MEKVHNLSYCHTDILGRGRYGTVFKGTLHYKGCEDLTVAVKKFSKEDTNFFKKDKVKNCLVHKTKHPNIIDYYCTKGKNEFM